MREIARMLKGRKVKPGVMNWVQTDTPTYWRAHRRGRRKISHQTCAAVTGFHHYPKGITIATNSYKYSKLAGGMGSKWAFANPETLANAAVTGAPTPSERWNYWTKLRELRQADELHLGFTGSATA